MRQPVLGLLLAVVLGYGLGGIARAQEEAPTPPHQQWSFEGVFGTYDRAELQRGFQVYKEVCSVCHPVKHLYYRDLEELGYSEDQVKGIAAQAQVTDGPNDQAARAANNGALPPDLSLITKAREGGSDYVYAILTGFKNPPAGMKMNPNMYYDEYFAGHQIAMPPPLAQADQVKYADGTAATVPEMAHDVVSFLSWAAEPNLDERHRMGFKVILFLIIAIGIFYAAKRKIWARVH